MSSRSVYICVLIFVTAFALRAGYVLETRQYENLERFEMERAAISLAHTGVLGNPYALPTGPTAHVSPFYPAFLSLIFRIFGTGERAEIVKMLAACATTALGCALIPLVGIRLGFDRRAAVLGGFFAALLPLKFQTQTMGDWESPFAALALMMLVALTAWLWTERRWTRQSAIVSGLAWGGCLLVSYAFILLYWAVLAVGLTIAGRGNYRRYLRFGLVQTVLMVLCLAPWAIRNYRELGAPIFGRTNTGLELRLSNNDLAAASEQTNFRNGLYLLYHPLQSVAQARLVQQLGEVKFNRIAIGQAQEWIYSHPGRFFQLTAERFGLFWFPLGGGLVKAFMLCAITALGWAGLLYIWNRNRTSALVLGLVWLVVPLPNYLVHVSLKHSYPLDWSTTMLAAVSLVALYDRLSARAAISSWLTPLGTGQGTLPELSHRHRTNFFNRIPR